MSGEQWHYDNLSIVNAGNCTYLIITPTEYYYSYLGAFSYSLIRDLVGDYPSSYRPYVRNGYLGWLVYGNRGVYFAYYVSNRWYYAQLYSRPVYYNYHYNLYGARYVDMRRWHFAPPPGPRPNYHYHHHHHHGTPPPQNHHGNHHGTPPPQNHNHGGYVPGSQRGSGTTTRPTNPPSNGRPNGSVRPSNPPSGGRSGSTVRSSGSSSGGSRSGGYTPGPSRSSGGYTPGPSRSSGGSSGGSVSRPPSGSRGSSPAPRSSGSSTRRR